jgi:hypothetical protein
MKLDVTAYTDDEWQRLDRNRLPHPKDTPHPYHDLVKRLRLCPRCDEVLWPSDKICPHCHLFQAKWDRLASWISAAWNSFMWWGTVVVVLMLIGWAFYLVVRFVHWAWYN